MLVNCLKLQYSVISASIVTNSHTLLLAPALQAARQIELDGNLICSVGSIRIDYSQL